MTPIDGTGAAAPSARAVFALVQIGDVRVGVPSASVVQVVPRPAQLMTLPRRSKVIEGLVPHAGRLLPVLRLDRWVDMGAAGARAEERILVLRDAGRLIGVLVDAVTGVRRLSAAEQVRIHRDDGGDELFQSVAAGVEGEPGLSLLEVGRLMALANVWCDDGGVDGAATSLDDGFDAALPHVKTVREEAWASFRIGDGFAAIRAADIGELIPCPPLQHGLPLQSEARGIIHWRGRFVPVVDLTRAIGGCVDPAPAPWVCIVRRGEHAVGVLVHEATALLALDASTLASASAPRPVDGDPALILGATLSETTRTVLLVATGGLMRLYPEVAISARPDTGEEDDGRHDARCTPSAFMVFDAGTPFASPIQAVQEVIALPPALLTRMDAGVPATIDWRGHVVPLVDLRQRAGSDDAMALKQLVIIADGDERAAVAIGGVRALVPARATTRRRFPGGARGSIDMVMVEMPNHQASYAVLDLKAFVGR